jgi:NADPH-dependent 2,4-dienoyl-CoA reductase/sulfur reductase-like enzyme
MSHVLVIGGSDAGISAALRAREVDPTCQVTVVVADQYPNFSICGLPFYLSGETPDWRALAHRTRGEIEAQGIRLELDQSAVRLDLERRCVIVRGTEGTEREYSYDQMVLATGARPRRPPINGLNQDGVFFLHEMASSFQLQRYLSDRRVRRAVIIGGGYIGLEMADALTHRGIAVTLMQRGASVLHTVDSSIGAHIRAELERHQVKVVTGEAASAIVRDGSGDDALRVQGANGFEAETDVVLVAAGVEPNTALARAAGLRAGVQGALSVDQRMATNLPGVFAAGDCVVTHHRLLPEPTYLPLGTTAHKQGRVAGENAVGGHRVYAGSVGTQVVKVFDTVIARTGLLEREALAAGCAPLTVEVSSWDHKVYYPGAAEMTVRLTADQQSMGVLGAQMVGSVTSAVAKRIDVVAAGLFGGATVDQLNDFDLSYTPPLGSPWDPLQLAAQAWLTAWAARQQGKSVHQHPHHTSLGEVGQI